VLHKHHPIIRVGTGLIQFVYRSHLRLATEATRNRNAFSPFFPRVHNDLHSIVNEIKCEFCGETENIDIDHIYMFKNLVIDFLVINPD